MFFDLLNTTCTIYRLTGFTGHNFSVSEEGEVDESWPTVSSNIACRIDEKSTYSRRRPDGVVETGPNVLFVETSTDIVDGDRVSVDGKYYQVVDSQTIDGMKDPHHKEVVIELIDWTNS